MSHGIQLYYSSSYCTPKIQVMEENGESMLTLLEVKKIDRERDAIFQNFDLEESNNIVALKKKKKELAEIIHNLGPVI